VSLQQSGAVFALFVVKAAARRIGYD